MGLKKVLIIINPCSGTKRANKYLTDIVDIFTTAGFVATVITTTKRGDGIEYAKTMAKDFDLITAIGGDGTFNEVVAGLVASGVKVPLGYIPAGSTNDFAQSLHIPKNILDAARNIVNGEPVAIDIGKFNDRYFSYVASFGAFTKASYATSQNVKNALGHLAYILEGISSITSIKAEPMKITANGQTYEEDFIFGAISNSTSMGGILKLSPDLVDMSDGFFEMLLVKAPKDLIDLTEIITMLTMQDFERSDKLIFLNSNKFEIEANKETSWSLDGEYQEGRENIVITNEHLAIELMMR